MVVKREIDFGSSWFRFLNNLFFYQKDFIQKYIKKF